MTGRRTATVVVVGDELLAGAHPDANGPAVAFALAERGVTVEHVAVVADDEEAIAAAVRAAADVDVVVATGGLGPTLDDVTRHGVARALGRELVESPEARAQIEAWYARRGGDMPAANLRQALVPAGAEVLPNAAGTAPGFLAEDGRRLVAVLPGPPSELRAMLHAALVPALDARGVTSEQVPTLRLHLFGLSESVFAESAGAWMARDATPLAGCTVKQGVLTVTLRARDGDLGALERRASELRERFASHLFSEADPRVELALANELRERGKTVALAESCTGGLAAAFLTRISGISASFLEARVTYANAAKERLLGVPAELLERHGAVSCEVAAAMAEGVRARSGADLGLSITGVAGPGGGTDEKPVGTICFGVAWDGEVHTLERRLPPTEREWIRRVAARSSLFLGWKALRGDALA